MAKKKAKDLTTKELDNIHNINKKDCYNCPLHTHDIYCLRGIVIGYRKRRRKFGRTIFKCIDFEEDLNKEIEVPE